MITPKPMIVRRAWGTIEGNVYVSPRGSMAPPQWYYKLSHKLTLAEAEDLQRQLLRAILKARTCKPS